MDDFLLYLGRFRWSGLQIHWAEASSDSTNNLHPCNLLTDAPLEWHIAGIGDFGGGGVPASYGKTTAPVNVAFGSSKRCFFPRYLLSHGHG
jgi:hypothetical protein